MKRRALCSIGAAALLAGCAGIGSVTSDVSSFGDWTAGRAPGSYAFERLPSQQAQPQRQAELEAAATRALEKAGFAPASDAAQADVIVQVGARLTRIEVSPWDDPLWWRWGPGYWRSPVWRPARAPFHSPYWSLRADWGTRYERNVAVLLRDRSSGTPLYEAHAQTDGATTGSAALLAAMFEAALQDFPASSAKNPRSVSVTLTPSP